ncbi:MAG: PepSY-associated TM helix domain-containing protein [Myxococcota bacterium]
MKPTLRQSMTLLHTWAGVLLGSLLFVIFWMGTLSVFTDEIDRWMMPDTRRGSPLGVVSLDAVAAKAIELGGPQTRFISVSMPEPRTPVARVRIQSDGGARHDRYLNVSALSWVPDPETAAASRFLYPMHYSLHLPQGYWLVGLCAMAMLALLVSGVIIHRSLIADFFTFRPGRRLARTSLDLHNLSSVVALPFHFMITLSGLVIFFALYYPMVQHAVYPELSIEEARNELFKESEGRYTREASGEPGSLASLDAMYERARSYWDGEPLRYFTLNNPLDAAGYATFGRLGNDHVSAKGDRVVFSSGTGELLQEPKLGPALAVQRFLSGMHQLRFDHWVLRWLYFIAGLFGCVMIATGYIYWLETRRKRHAADGLPGIRIVEGLTCGSVTGLIAATLAFLVANRLLPMGFSIGSLSRLYSEIVVFYLVWVGSFVHAWARPTGAWVEQLRFIALLAFGAVVLNWATTGDHLLKTLSDPHWPVAGVDLLLLCTGVLALRAGKRVARSSAGRRRSGLEPAARQP